MEPNQPLTLPSDFIWRRLHSLTGLWLSIYIILHLFTNAQAALPIGDDGKGFIHDVNWIHNFPFLKLIELTVLGLPIVIHAVWGVKYLFTSKINSYSNEGQKPYLNYGRNKAYTWQRITAWILLFGLAAHIVHMRFIEYPEVEKSGKSTYYTVQVSDDPGIAKLHDRIEFNMTQEKDNKVKIRADNFGTTTLFMLRNTFKSPLMMALYTLFVLAACFHAFNGLWTFMITWGVTLTERSQRIWLRVCQAIMLGVAFLGLAAIYGTFWINLKQ